MCCPDVQPLPTVHIPLFSSGIYASAEIQVLYVRKFSFSSAGTVEGLLVFV